MLPTLKAGRKQTDMEDSRTEVVQLSRLRGCVHRWGDACTNQSIYLSVYLYIYRYLSIYQSINQRLGCVACHDGCYNRFERLRLFPASFPGEQLQYLLYNKCFVILFTVCVIRAALVGTDRSCHHGYRPIKVGLVMPS